MDIGDISSMSLQSMNQAYVPFSSASSVMGTHAGENNTFDEILKRTQSSAQNSNRGDEIPIRVSEKLPIDKSSKLYELCLELETFLVKNLIKSMRSTVQKSGLVDSGFAGQIYEDMLYDEYAKEFTKGANLGFAEMAYRDLTRNGF